MADNKNYNRPNQNQDKSAEAEKPNLVSAYAHNIFGKPPMTMSYYVEVDEINKETLTLCQKFLIGVKSVTTEIERRKEYVIDEDGKEIQVESNFPVMIMWIDGKSDDMVDRSIMRTNKAIINPSPRISENMKTFCQKYSIYNDIKDLRFEHSEENREVKGIILSIPKLLNYYFDIKGYDFKKLNPNFTENVDTSLKIIPDFQDKERRRLRGYRVEKRVASVIRNRNKRFTRRKAGKF